MNVLRFQAENEYKHQLSDWLQTYHWDYFHTITFRKPRRDSIAALRDVSDVLSSRCSRAFITVEPHYTGFLHLHAISFQDPNIRPYYLPWEIEGAYRKYFGISAVQTIRGQEEIANYCSKYVAKSRANYTFLGASYHWKE